MRILLALFWVLMLPAGLHAETAGDIHSARVQVADQSPQELSRAAREGLAEVVVRLTGRQSSLANPVIGQELSRAEQWLSRFGYSRVPADQPGGTDVLWLDMAFDPEQTSGLVSRAGMPLWGGQRPGVLVWVVLDAGGRQLASAQAAPALYQGLQRAAVRRGIPLIQPMVDLEDEMALPADAAWAFDVPRIDAASARYHADARLIARVSVEPGDRFSGEWLLLSPGAPLQRAAAGSAEEFAAAGVEFAAEQLASHYAAAPVGGAGSQLYSLQVSGIDSLARQRELLRHLAQSSGVGRVELQRVEGERVQLRLEYTGPANRLADVLTLGGRMKLEVAGDAAAVPSYRWQ